ncbi:hypothetical protein AMK59_2777 [Oryctes borbonicus]|uniref:DNA-directed DNA polymerase n=1 Tax=Oryctes borbonicus TaxID=1629725 RepID=A0A0T6BFE9_9SCAR|nr:hypothetical protein AMK59_2777 [Oryctes borbonicus]
MYDFYYNLLKRKYQEKVCLCYMDTDSFILEINTDDVYCDMKQNVSKFDTSNFSVDNVYGIPPQNKTVLGLFKDENSGNIINEFVGLRSKGYSIRVEGSETKKMKGVKRSVVKNEINFEDYKNCLFNRNLVYK